jgi:hypothetical protein
VTGVSGTTYDFSNMTNAQAYAAADQLGNAGKITVDQQSQVMNMAQGADTMNPADSGTITSTAYMNSTTPQDFLTKISNDLATAIREHNVANTAMDSVLLTALSAYQETAESASVTSVPGDGVSTTA